MKRQYATYVIGLLVILILSFGWCSDRKHNRAFIDGLHNENLALKKRVAKDSTIIYEMQQVNGSEKNARVLAESEAKYYKSLLAVVKVKVGVQVKNIEAKYDTIVLHDTIVKDSIVGDCIPVGTNFSYSDKWFYTAGEIGAQNVKFDSIGFTAGTVKVIIGDKKKGFLKRAQPTVSLVVENPHFTVTQANNIVVQEKRKPKRGLWLLTGIAVGLVGGILIH